MCGSSAIFPRDRGKLYRQPVTTLQKDRASHALEEDAHYTTGTRMRGAQSCGTAELVALALEEDACRTNGTRIPLQRICDAHSRIGRHKDSRQTYAFRDEPSFFLFFFVAFEVISLLYWLRPTAVEIPRRPLQLPGESSQTVALRTGRPGAAALPDHSDNLKGIQHVFRCHQPARFPATDRRGRRGPRACRHRHPGRCPAGLQSLTERPAIRQTPRTPHG